MTASALGLALAGVASLTQIGDGDRTMQKPSMPDVEAVERAFSPSGKMLPLDGYARYYWQDPTSGLISGKYIRSSALLKPGIRVIDSSRKPHVADGGCANIDVRYDKASGAPPSFECGNVR